MRPLARETSKLTQSAFEDRGFYAGRILTHWPEIVGPELARHSCPEKLGHNGVLTIRVAGGHALEMQHLEPQIIGRIATYFGHRAVTRLALRQGPLPTKAPAPPPPKPVDPAARAAIATATQDIEDSGLRAALRRLGLALHRRNAS